MYIPKDSAHLPIAYSAKNIISGEKPKSYRGDHEKQCDCGKYIACEMTGKCYTCQRMNAQPFFNNK